MPIDERRLAQITQVRTHSGVMEPSIVYVDTTETGIAHSACSRRVSDGHCLRSKGKCVGTDHCTTRESGYTFPLSTEAD